MITATEALAIYEQTGADVKKFLKEEIEQKIKYAASQGKRSIFVCLTSYESYTQPSLKSYHKKAVEELASLGYTVSLGRDGDPYVPRGLADDDGDGPRHINYGLHIGW